MFRTIGSRFSGTAVSPHKNIQCVIENAIICVIKNALGRGLMMIYQVEMGKPD